MNKIFLIIILAVMSSSTFGTKGDLPDQFSFQASHSGKDVNGEYYQDYFTVTALGQVFWETSSNIDGSCPLLAGRLKGNLEKKELTEFALLAKESLNELTSNSMASTQDNKGKKDSHKWDLTFGDNVYSSSLDSGKENVQKLQILIDSIKHKLDASSVVFLKAKKDKDGSFEVIFKYKGVGHLALIFTEKVSDTFGNEFSKWKYYQMPDRKIVLSKQIPQYKIRLIPPKNAQAPNKIIYSNTNLADHYESSELGDQKGYRPIKICTQL